MAGATTFPESILNLPLGEQVRRRLVDFLLWVLMVKVTFVVEEDTLGSIKSYLANNPGKSLLFSIAPHTGHPDSMYFRQLLDTYLPEITTNFMMVADKTHWNNPLRQPLTKLVGPTVPFDRDPSAAAKELRALAQILKGNDDIPATTLGIYSQGGRGLDLPLSNSVVGLSELSGSPIVVINLLGSEDVLPKVDHPSRLYFQKIHQRVHSLFTGELPTNVTIELAGMLRPEKRLASKSNRKTAREDVLQKYFHMHRANQQGYIQTPTAPDLLNE